MIEGGGGTAAYGEQEAAAEPQLKGKENGLLLIAPESEAQHPSRKIVIQVGDGRHFDTMILHLADNLASLSGVFKEQLLDFLCRFERLELLTS